MKEQNKEVSSLAWVVAAVAVIAVTGLGMRVLLNRESAPSASDNTAPISQASPSGGTPTGNGANNSSTGSGAGVSAGGGQVAPVSGTIKAISDTSITLLVTGPNTVQTFTTTSDTDTLDASTNAIGAYRASDFKAGQSIGFIPVGSGSTQIKHVLLNFQTQSQ